MHFLRLACILILTASVSATNFTYNSVSSDSIGIGCKPSYTSHAVLAIGILTTVSIYAWDEKINQFFSTKRTSILYKGSRGLSDLAQFYGEDNMRVLYLYSGLTGTLLAGGYFGRNDKMIETTWLMTKAMGYTQLLTWGVKMTIGRARPNVNKGADEFYWFEFSKNKDRRSFLSGHTASAFAMMTVIAKQSENWWIKGSAYLFATAAAFQRVVHHHHWASDVLIGGATGYYIGSAVVHSAKISEKEKNSNELTALLTPWSLYVSYTF